MGIRCDQFIGLSKASRLYLDENCQKDHVEIFINQVKESEHYKYKTVQGKFFWYPMYDDYDSDEGSLLPGYVLKDGSILYEVVQKEISSSGNVIFTCLADENGKKIRKLIWKSHEINEYY